MGFLQQHFAIIKYPFFQKIVFLFIKKIFIDVLPLQLFNAVYKAGSEKRQVEFFIYVNNKHKYR